MNTTTTPAIRPPHATPIGPALDFGEEELLVWQELRPLLGRLRHRSELEVRRLLDVYEVELLEWSLSGLSSDELHRSQRRLYALTGGKLAELELSARRRVHPPRTSGERVEGVLGSLGRLELRELAARLERDGVAVFPHAVSAEQCDAWERYARTEPSRPRYDGGRFGEPAPYGAHAEKATRYSIESERILARPDLLRFTFDDTLIALARAYLGCEPAVTKAEMHWSTPAKDEPDSAAAQPYHYDLDHLNSIKVFVYITQVDADRGPHCFVRGSHHFKPTELRRDGRLSDAGVEACYERDDLFELTGSRGTVIVEDTRGFHRAKALRTGERLLLTLEYSASLAGKEAEELRVPASDWARAHSAAHPRLWRRFSLAT